MRTKRFAGWLIFAAATLVAACWAFGLLPVPGLPALIDSADRAVAVACAVALGAIAGASALAALRGADGASRKQGDADLTPTGTDPEESEKRFRTIAETVPVAIGISRFDDGAILYVNNRWRRLHAVPDDEDVVGRTAASLYKMPHDRSALIGELEDKGEVQDREIEFERLDGEAIAVSLSARVVDFGGERAILLAFQDFTERKSAEKELMSATLQAEAANTAKSSFIATMSHELRTPLNAIIGMSDVMIQSDPTEQQREDIEIIREAGHALLAIIDDILDISKIEAGKLELDPVAFDVRDVLTSVSNLLGPNAEEKGLALDWSVATDVPALLLGDFGRLRQIVLNVAANAVKFTDQGKVSISVACDSQDTAGVGLRFEVTDTGIGIRESVQATLFDRFMQADTSNTRRFGGTGLGLAICRELCSLMNGQIGVDSEIGKGSTFWFTVMLQRSTAGQRAFVEAASDVNVPDRAQLPGLRILLAEDSKINQKVITALLSKAGHRVTVVENGVEAVNAIQDTPCDLILMDVLMPEMDGIAATKAIRAFGGDRASMPIIALTANAMKGDREACLDAGMNDYVVKPIDPAQLAQAINRVCGAETALESAVPAAAQTAPPLTGDAIADDMTALFETLDSVAGKSE